MSGVMAVVISYNPIIPLLQEDLDALFSQIDRVVLMDNGSENIDQVRTLSRQYARLQLVENGENLGLPVNYNRAAHMAHDEGFQWLLTMDQDTVIPEGMIDAFLQYAPMKNVAVIGPAIWNVNRVSIDEVRAALPDEPYTYVDEFGCISSASMNRVDTLLQLGGFDEKLFIDWVDFDYCKNVQIHGYDILRVNSCIARHQIGDHPEKRYRFLWRTITKTKSPPQRCYYSCRNRLYYIRKYNLPVSARLGLYLKMGKWSIRALLVFPHDPLALQKVRMAFCGLRDGRHL